MNKFIVACIATRYELQAFLRRQGLPALYLKAAAKAVVYKKLKRIYH